MNEKYPPTFLPTDFAAKPPTAPPPQHDIRADVRTLLARYPLAHILLAMSEAVDDAHFLSAPNAVLRDVSRAIRETIGRLPFTFGTTPILND